MSSSSVFFLLVETRRWVKCKSSWITSSTARAEQGRAVCTFSCAEHCACYKFCTFIYFLQINCLFLYLDYKWINTAQLSSAFSVLYVPPHWRVELYLPQQLKFGIWTRRAPKFSVHSSSTHCQLPVSKVDLISVHVRNDIQKKFFPWFILVASTLYSCAPIRGVNYNMSKWWTGFKFFHLFSFF